MSSPGELALDVLHGLFGYADTQFVGLRDKAYDRMFLLPCHGLGVADDSIDGVEQSSVPMILQNAPTTFHGVVLAVVRRIVGKADVDLMLLNEVHHPAQELSSSSTVLGAIVLKKNQRVDLRKPGLVLGPPVVDRIHDAVAGDFGCADRN